MEAECTAVQNVHGHATHSRLGIHTPDLIIKPHVMVPNVGSHERLALLLGQQGLQQRCHRWGQLAHASLQAWRASCRLHQVGTSLTCRRSRLGT
jgi:hypothetical protein